MPGPIYRNDEDEVVNVDEEEDDEEEDDDDDDFLMVPEKKAMKARFPPGSRVIATCVDSYTRGGSPSVPTSVPASICYGTVVHVGINFASRKRETLYKILPTAGMNQKQTNLMVLPEGDLQFAPFSPVWVYDTDENKGSYEKNTDDNSNCTVKKSGFILLASEQYTPLGTKGTGSFTTTLMYTVQMVQDGRLFQKQVPAAMVTARCSGNMNFPLQTENKNKNNNNTLPTTSTSMTRSPTSSGGSVEARTRGQADTVPTVPSGHINSTQEENNSTAMTSLANIVSPPSASTRRDKPTTHCVGPQQQTNLFIVGDVSDRTTCNHQVSKNNSNDDEDDDDEDESSKKIFLRENLAWIPPPSSRIQSSSLWKRSSEMAEHSGPMKKRQRCSIELNSAITKTNQSNATNPPSDNEPMIFRYLRLPAQFGVDFFRSILLGEKGAVRKALNLRFNCDLILGGTLIPGRFQQGKRSSSSTGMDHCWKIIQRWQLFVEISGSSKREIREYLLKVQMLLYAACSEKLRETFMRCLTMCNFWVRAESGIVYSALRPTAKYTSYDFRKDPKCGNNVNGDDHNDDESGVFMAQFEGCNGPSTDCSIIRVQEAKKHVDSLAKQYPTCRISIREYFQRHPDVGCHILITGPTFQEVYGCREHLYRLTQQENHDR